MIEIRAVLDHRGVEELVHDAGDWEGNIVVRSCLHDDVQVLEVKSDSESRIKIATDHSVASVFEDAATSESAAKHIDDSLRIDSGFRAECDRFADAGDGYRHEHLITSLDDLT